jgi:hypothetical protein
MIRYHRSLGRKLCRLGIGAQNASPRVTQHVAWGGPGTMEKLESLGSGGSMVARLKLKGIDGRAPPGVEPAA